MTYEKLFNEIYAVVSLKYLWANYKDGFEKSESPDWINPNMDFGMEVTQALIPEDGRAESFIESFLGCPKEELPDTAWQHYGDRLYFYNERFWALLPIDDDRFSLEDKAKNSFLKKIEKLNNNYDKYGTNALYIYVHPNNNPFDADSVFAYMLAELQNWEFKFDLVFLNCNNIIYVCDLKNNNLQTIEIPETAMKFLEAETEKLRANAE